MIDAKLQKGRKKTGGRIKGTPNKSTVEIKSAIMNAFEKVGGESYLTRVAVEDPKTFCALLAKILPAELKATIEGVDRSEILARARQRIKEQANI